MTDQSKENKYPLNLPEPIGKRKNYINVFVKRAKVQRSLFCMMGRHMRTVIFILAMPSIKF